MRFGVLVRFGLSMDRFGPFLIVVSSLIAATHFTCIFVCNVIYQLFKLQSFRKCRIVHTANFFPGTHKFHQVGVPYGNEISRILFRVNVGGTRQFTGKTIHRQGFRRQFTTLLKTVHRHFFIMLLTYGSKI